MLAVALVATEGVPVVLGDGLGEGVDVAVGDGVPGLAVGDDLVVILTAIVSPNGTPLCCMR